MQNQTFGKNRLYFNIYYLKESLYNEENKQKNTRYRIGSSVNGVRILFRFL